MYRVVLIFLIVSFGFAIPKNMVKKIDKEIKNVFSIDNYTKELIIFEGDLSNQLLVSFKEDNFHKISSEKKHIGFFYFGKAPSKTDEFDFLVIFDKNLIIKKIKILAYREDYGMEIGSVRWLKQFNDLTKGDKVAYQKDIKAISGATISAKSMTKAINGLLQSLTILQNKNQL